MRLSPAQEGLSRETLPDLFALGLLLAIVGCFLLANSIVFRHPRTLVAQFFGVEEKRLTSIRAYIFHRVQVHLGFLFLLAGFGFQLFGRFDESATRGAITELPVLWVGVVVLVVVVLELAGWRFSHLLFRRYVREFFLDHPPNLERDFALARELGELFGVPSQEGDSVQSYLLRVRHRIGIYAQAPPRAPRDAEGLDADLELDEAEPGSRPISAR